MSGDGSCLRLRSCLPATYCRRQDVNALDAASGTGLHAREGVVCGSVCEVYLRLSLPLPPPAPPRSNCNFQPSNFRTRGLTKVSPPRPAAPRGATVHRLRRYGGTDRRVGRRGMWSTLVSIYDGRSTPTSFKGYVRSAVLPGLGGGVKIQPSLCAVTVARQT